MVMYFGIKKFTVSSIFRVYCLLVNLAETVIAMPVSMAGGLFSTAHSYDFYL